MGAQFVLTIGTVVLGLFVASRVLGIEAGGRGASQPGGKRGGKWDSGRCVGLSPTASSCCHRVPEPHGSRQ